MPLAFPLMAAIQSMCARIGRVTGKGLAANIKAAFPPLVLQGVVLLLLVANTLNIAADVAAMGEVGRTGHRLRSPSDDGVLRGRNAAAADFRPLSPLCLLPEVADAVAAGLCRGAVHGSRALGRGGAAHGLAEVHAECRRPPPWSSASSAPPSAPICSSGRRPRRSRTCRRARRRAAAARCACRGQRNCAASAGTPGAACSTPTSRPISSSWRRRSRCTWRESPTSIRRRRRPARFGRWPAISPICCSRSAFSASA